MTRARSLKQTIRARAAKTGERYTTARRQILKQRDMRAIVDEPEGASPQKVKQGPPRPAAKPTMSDASFVKATGHDLAHWFTVLDRFGAAEKGHTASARHLYQDHKVDGWYAQGITVSYERARGLRAVNQRVDGGFEVSASKTIAASTRAIARALSEARLRRHWIVDADPALADALKKGLADKKSKGVVIRENGIGSLRYKWGATSVQFYIAPKAGGRTIVTVTHSKLPDAGAVEQYRALWRTALAALAGSFTA